METRKQIDCRDYPNEKKCSLKISGTEDEVVRLAAQHAIDVHEEKDTPELRSELRKMLKDDAEESAKRQVA